MTSLPRFDMPRRRLIGADELAKKIGHTRSWIYTHRDRLEAIGFPPPVLGGMKDGRRSSQPLRWDDHAIDLWLDSRMPPALLKREETTMTVSIDRDAMEQRLAGNARRMTL